MKVCIYLIMTKNAFITVGHSFKNFENHGSKGLETRE